MKLQVTKNTYKETNTELYISEDYKTINAYSYGRWRFIERDSVGNVIFIDSSYSSSTSGHQSTARSILRRLGIDVHLKLRKTLLSMSRDSIKTVIQDEIKLNRDDIRDLIKAIRKKGSWTKTNLERRESIESMLYRIKDLRRFKNEYLNKKLFPLKKKKLKDFIYYSKNEHYSSWQGKEELSYRHFFKKPNGVLDKNSYVNFLNKVKHYGNAPQDLTKLINLLGLKKSNTETLLIYQYSQDTSNMIPNQDTVEYKQLQSWLKKHPIDKDNLTTLKLDKLHQYLTDKMNRKTYSPREAVQLPMNEKLLKIESKIQDSNILKLVKTDQDLRREGRQQSHCIGGKHYLEKCFRGYQALRFKGYTFFLTPDLKIDQTNGKRNAWTPENIRTELNEILTSEVA